VHCKSFSSCIPFTNFHFQSLHLYSVSSLRYLLILPLYFIEFPLPPLTGDGVGEGVGVGAGKLHLQNVLATSFAALDRCTNNLFIIR
jgi:hypothetical protein